MGMTADALLAGPRGRGLVIALLRNSDVYRLIMRADHAGSGGRSAAFSMLSVGAVDGLSGMRVAREMRRARKRAQQEFEAPVAADELARAVEVAIPDARLTEPALIDALAHTVGAAKAYQPPDASEALIAAPQVIEALRPLAEQVIALPLAQRWTAPAASEQWLVTRPERAAGVDAGLAPEEVLEAWLLEVADEESRARRERARGQRVGGTWWSFPPHPLARTTGAQADLGPTGLYAEEDSSGGDDAVVTPVGPVPASTYEISGIAAWAELCARFPLDVTESRSMVWDEALGGEGPWVIPDWRAVAVEYDAVHLTVAGYLEGATRRIEVPGVGLSGIAGFDPDLTVWLTRHPAATGDAEAWSHGDTTGWRSIGTPPR